MNLHRTLTCCTLWNETSHKHDLYCILWKVYLQFHKLWSYILKSHDKKMYAIWLAVALKSHNNFRVLFRIRHPMTLEKNLVTWRKWVTVAHDLTLKSCLYSMTKIPADLDFYIMLLLLISPFLETFLGRLHCNITIFFTRYQICHVTLA